MTRVPAETNKKILLTAILASVGITILYSVIQAHVQGYEEITAQRLSGPQTPVVSR